MNYNQHLNDLMTKYNLKSAYCETTIVEHQIMNYIKVNCKEQILIVGTGKQLRHIEPLINNPEKYVLVIESNKDRLTDILINSYSRKKNIYYCSIFEENSFKENIIDNFPQMNWIDLAINVYNLPINDIGVFLHDNYNSFKWQYDLFLVKTMYELSTNKVEIEFFLKELIVKYLTIKDFINAKMYIQEFIDIVIDKKNHYKNFLSELNSLLSELKSSVKKRKNSDVSLLMIDSFRYKSFEENKDKIPFIKKLSEKGINFSDAFSGTTYTVQSIKSVLTGKKTIDDRLYESTKVDFAKSIFQHFSSKGYNCFHFGGKQFFSEGSPISTTIYPTLLQPMTSILWDYIICLANEKKPTFSLVHLCGELHTPILSSQHKEIGKIRDLFWYYKSKNELEKKQVLEDMFQRLEEAMEYLDKQLRFYFDFFPPNISMAIFGDHGEQIGEYNQLDSMFTWYEETIKIPLILYNKQNHIHQNQDNLFSMVDFKDMFINFMDLNNVVIPICDYIQVQRDPVYNKSMRSDNIFINGVGEKFFKGFKVIRGKNDKFIIYEDGTEEYYLIENEEVNLINEAKFQTRIEEMRGIVNKDFPNFNL